MDKETYIELSHKYNFQDFYSRQDCTDLQSLRDCLNDLVPSILIRDTGVSQLPFQPEIVSSITEDDVAILNDAFKPFDIGTTSTTFYEHWARIYFYINLVFIASSQNGWGLDISNEIIDQASEFKISSALLFFVLAQAHLSEEQKGDLVAGRSGDKADLNTALLWAKKRKQSIEDLLSDVAVAKAPKSERLDNSTLNWMRRDLGRRIISHGLAEELEGLKEQISNHESFRLGTDNHKYKGAPHSRTDTTELTRVAFLLVRTLIEENWKNYGALPATQRLFELWGIEINANTARSKRWKNK